MGGIHAFYITKYNSVKHITNACWSPTAWAGTSVSLRFTTAPNAGVMCKSAELMRSKTLFYTGIILVIIGLVYLRGPAVVLIDYLVSFGVVVLGVLVSIIGSGDLTRKGKP